LKKLWGDEGNKHILKAERNKFLVSFVGLLICCFRYIFETRNKTYVTFEYTRHRNRTVQLQEKMGRNQAEQKSKNNYFTLLSNCYIIANIEGKGRPKNSIMLRFIVNLYSPLSMGFECH